jgi:galactose mutarotase-like enzyme
VTLRAAPFGDSSLGPVQVLTIGTEPGPVLELLDLGASVHRLWVTGGDGVRRNVVLGHPSPEAYLASTNYLGATVGRYANRIAGGRLPVDGHEVRVGTNDRGNTLHGGPEGFSRRLWEVVDGSANRARLRLVSADGDQGFPGRLEVVVLFEVTADGVRVGFEATTDATTVVNLTSHAYFNLDGEGAGTVDDHLLSVAADDYLPVDDSGIPSGGPAPVRGTPFDLRRPTRVGDCARDGHPQVAAARGIDHNFCLHGSGFRTVATVDSRRTDTRMELLSDQPGLQVYSGNFLDGALGSTRGRLYRQGDGLALEPQLFPDSPNRPDFASPVLRPGDTYRAVLEWRFLPLR